MASGRVDTMSDFLRQIMGSLSEAKLVADADLPFLLDLEQRIVQKMRDPITRMQQAGIMPGSPGQVPAGGADPGMMGDLPPGFGDQGAAPQQSMPPSMAGMGGVRGVPTGPPQINPDELRRMLTQHQ